MTRRQVKDEYFNWLSEFVCRGPDSYSRLLAHLHRTTFRYLIPKDLNRAEDGEALRYRFALIQYPGFSPDTILDILDRPCSVLEMMVALAIRCEEDIMDDPNIGNRTGQWFWGMIVNLGLGAMRDSRYDEQYVDYALDTFLNREYDYDGAGGLFTVRNCDRDMRDVEIWHQLCWYLDEIT